MPWGKALLALEASRYLKVATGWPTVTGALTCLQLKVRGQTPTDIRDVIVPAFRQVRPPALPAEASSKQQTQLVAGGEGFKGGNVTPEMQAFLDKLERSRNSKPRPPIPRVMPGKLPASHDERVGELLRAGWRHDDILAALKATQEEGGEENLATAQDYLENLRQWRLENANVQSASKAPEAKDEGPDRIPEGSELAVYIAVNPDHIDVCLHLIEVHDMNQRSHAARLIIQAACLTPRTLHASCLTASSGTLGELSVPRRALRI